MGALYSIRDWNENFENAGSRKLKGAHGWVPIPTKHDGKSYRRLMMMPRGPEIYAAWILIIQVAAKCPTRGVLADQDGPLTEDDLSIKTSCPAELFSAALKVLASKEIGWLLVEPWERSGSTVALPTIPTIPNQPTNQPKPIPPHSHSEPSDDADSNGLAGGRERLSGWGKVADRLAAMGASRWRETIAEAKSAGCNPGLALTLIDYGKSNGYGIGGIICRLAKARPTLPVEDGWPAKPAAPAAPAKPTPSKQEQDEMRRFEIIKLGRKSGKTPEQIAEELASEGLEA